MGWTSRSAVGGPPVMNAWDSIGNGGTSYPVTATWPGSCSSVNQAIIVALSGNQSSFSQSFANFFSSGSHASWPIAFKKQNTAGSCLVLDIAFVAGSYTAGPVSVADSNGNAWTVAAAGNPGFTGVFIQTWVAPNCVAGSGVNTVTVTIGGSFPFTALAASIFEYPGCTGLVDASNYANGGGFGVGNTVNVSVTTASGGDLLHIVTMSQGCSGVVINGGGAGTPAVAIPAPSFSPAAAPLTTQVPASSQVYIVAPGQGSNGLLKIAANQLQQATQGAPDAKYWAVVQGALVNAQNQLDFIMKALRKPLPFPGIVQQLSPTGALYTPGEGFPYSATANIPLAVVHGLNGRVLPLFFREDGTWVIPSSVVLTDSNTVTVTFGTTNSGNMLAVRAGN